jgi:hypothetical protein
VSVLTGKRIVVTRAAHQSGEMESLLREHGAEPALTPALNAPPEKSLSMVRCAMRWQRLRLAVADQRQHSADPEAAARRPGLRPEFAQSRRSGHPSSSGAGGPEHRVSIVPEITSPGRWRKHWPRNPRATCFRAGSPARCWRWDIAQQRSGNHATARSGSAA